MNDVYFDINFKIKVNTEAFFSLYFKQKFFPFSKKKKKKNLLENKSFTFDPLLFDT